MKKYLLLFCVVPVLFTSCVPAGSMPALYGSTERADEKSKGEFVELNDGSFITGNITKVGLGKVLSKRTGNIIIDGKKYGYNEIVAFQKERIYYRKDAYNDFDERIVKGNINGYRSFHTGQSVNSKGMIHSFDYYLYFIQKGDKGSIVAYELKVLKKMIAGYQPAIDEYNKYNVLSKKQKRMQGNNILTNVIGIYNNK